MNTSAFVCAVAALTVIGSAAAQTTPESAKQQTTPPGQAPSSTAPARTTKDPSSTQGRPDASYPNPAGQDTRTEAAARPHKEKGHDDAADKNVVDPTASAGPSGKTVGLHGCFR